MVPRSLSEPEYQEWTAFLKKDYECNKRAEARPSRPEKMRNSIVKKKQRVPFATEKFQPRINNSPIYQATVVAAIYGTDECWVKTIPACYYRRH